MKISKIIISVLVLFAAILSIKWFVFSFKNKNDESIFVVGTSLDYPPYEYVDTKTGQAAGFDIDVCSEIANRLSKKLIIKNMPFTSLIFSLLSGDIDMIAAGMSPTERRARMVAFTDIYSQSKSLVILTKATHFQPNGVQDLIGKTVAVNTGYIADMYMSQQEGVHLIKLESPADCFLALQVGSVDAFVAFPANIDIFFKNHAHPEQFKVVEIEGTQEVCAFAINKNNQPLLLEINQVIQAMKHDGTLQKIQMKWGF